eukprot:3069405-Pyramimonas_sp.AAC.1
MHWETVDVRDHIAEHDMLSEIQSSAEDLMMDVQPPTMTGRPAPATPRRSSPGWFPWWRVDQLEGSNSGDRYL